MKTDNNKRERCYRILAIIFYLVLLCYVGGFSVRGMLDVRGMAAVALGTLLFSLPSIHEYVQKKRHDAAYFWNRVAYNGLMSGFLTAMLFLLAHLSAPQMVWDESAVHVTRLLSADLRPVLYGLCLYTVLHVQEQAHPEEETPLSGQKKGPTNDELYLHFQRSGLTNRETELAILAYRGYSNREIAEECYISEATVKKHMSHIFEKLGIAGREELQHQTDNIKIEK